MTINQFEIWIADFNLRKGTEPGKVRPVVIVQTGLLNKHHPSTVVCPITTKIERASEILRVHLPKGSCGLKETSDIMVDQVRAIDNTRLVKKVGNLPIEISERLKNNLQILFDLE